MFKLPSVLPAIYESESPGTASSDVDTGSYDVMIGGHGFRLATDQQNPYQRYTEQTTVHRFDSSLEVGEQTLSELPWIKSQASFHAGAGQLNLEQGLTAFQYQQEQVEHIRYDNSYGVDPWTPGEVKRLPDLSWYAIGNSMTKPAKIVAASSANFVECAAIGGDSFVIATWTAKGGTPTISAVSMPAGTYGAAGNWSIVDMATDGYNYYAVVTLAAAVGGNSSYVVSGSCDSAAAPTVLYNGAGFTMVNARLGWVKARLMLSRGPSIYELSTTAAAAALPTAKYTSPAAKVGGWGGFAESPNGIIAAVWTGHQSSLLELTLDSSGGTPTLTGGATIATLPPGERVWDIKTYVGSTLALGTSAGLRVGTFDTYTGSVTIGPLSVTTTSAVTGVTGRDRFLFALSNGCQPDGSDGLMTVDTSMIVDQGGRYAYAPGLRTPTNSPIRTAGMGSVALGPVSGRLLLAGEGGYLFIEGSGPGADGLSWLRTSRIRFDTAEPKLFTLGRIHGDLANGTVKIVASQPFGAAYNCGTFGDYTTSDAYVQFNLPQQLTEWLQLTFTLTGPVTFNSYQAKALPSPQRQNIIICTVNCFLYETDRSGQDITDPEIPRVRYQNLKDLETAGGVIRFTEFTNSGSVTTNVTIDQIQFQSFNRPTLDDDFGGLITLKLRELT